MAYRNNPITVILLMACLCGNLFTSTPSLAQEVTALTDDNVRAFIEKTSTIAAGRSSGMTEDEINEYLDKHLSPDARFKSTMRYTIPGFESQETKMSVDKEDFIKGVHKTMDKTVEDYENEIQIDEVQISGDGRKAVVKTRTHESAMMPVADEIEKKEVPVEGVSSCTQIIMLSKNDMIQMFNATCVTDIEFQTFDP